MNPLNEITFITGVDTNCGKTVLAALLLHHLLCEGEDGWAVKPFCSGSPKDLQILAQMHRRTVDPQELNLLYFSEALAPLVAARKQRRHYTLAQVLIWLKNQAQDHQHLIIEGSGGLLVPLGEGFTALDIVQKLGCRVLIAGRNKLGILNHTLLTISALRSDIRVPFKVVLLGVAEPDLSAKTNGPILREFVSGVSVVEIPFLGRKLGGVALKKSAKKFKIPLAKLLE